MGLTRQQLQVLRLIVAGLKNWQIGERLSITENTVKRHVSLLMKKLNKNTRVQLVVRAVEEGLAKLGSQ